jgi:hypothetical protein
MTVFYTTWFPGLISYIYKPATSSHFKPGLLRWRLWLGLPLNSEALLVKSSLIKILETRLLKIPEIRRFLISWIFTRFQLPWNRQQTREPKANSAIIFTQHLKVSELYEIYQDVFMNIPLSWNRIFHPEAHSWIYSRIRQLRHFEGARFLPNSPTIPPGTKCHTWFSEGNQMHLICAPGSSLHTYDRRHEWNINKQQ